jgi:cytochrome c
MRSIVVSIAATAGLMISGSVGAVEMPPLAKEFKCVTCHAIDHKVVGPAWQDVANKYSGKGVKKYTFKGKQYPLIEGLVMKVSQGGSGNWGSVPMPPNDPTGVNKAKITELVKFEQSLAKKNR